MGNTFPQIPVELCLSSISNDILDELVLRDEHNFYRYDIDELYFILGIDYWIGERKDYPILVLTWRDQ